MRSPRFPRGRWRAALNCRRQSIERALVGVAQDFVLARRRQDRKRFYPLHTGLDYLQPPFPVLFGIKFFESTVGQLDQCRGHALAEQAGDPPELALGLGTLDADAHGVLRSLEFVI